MLLKEYIHCCSCPYPGPEFPTCLVYLLIWGKRWLLIFFYIGGVENLFFITIVVMELIYTLATLQLSLIYDKYENNIINIQIFNTPSLSCTNLNYDCSLSLHRIGTSITSVGIKLVLWAQTSPLVNWCGDASAIKYLLFISENNAKNKIEIIVGRI